MRTNGAITRAGSFERLKVDTQSVEHAVCGAVNDADKARSAPAPSTVVAVTAFAIRP
jgi:hypothetical protein